MATLANELLPFLQHAPTISGSALMQRLLEEPQIRSLADSSELDSQGLIEAVATLEEHPDFKNADYERFSHYEELIRLRIGREIEKAGGAFPAWQLGDRCTPLGFAMLQGFATPSFAEHARAIEKHEAAQPFTGNPLNSVVGLTAHCMRLVQSHLTGVKGFEEFVRVLQDS